jgi:hypothetical protein
VHSLVFSSPTPVHSDTLKEIQDKYGLQLRSSSTAVNSQIKPGGDVAVVYFDKSSPGFDKVFDKTSPNQPGWDYIDPASLQSRLTQVEQNIQNQGGGQAQP